MQRTAKKCTKIQNARVERLFFLIEPIVLRRCCCHCCRRCLSYLTYLATHKCKIQTSNWIELKGVVFLWLLQEEHEETKEKKKESEDETKEKHDEVQEEKETERKDEEDQTAKKQEEKSEEPGLKPKHRRSFNLFKRKKVEKTAEKLEEKLEETDAPEEETPEIGAEDDIAADDIELKEAEQEDVEVQIERADEHRRSFNLFKRRKAGKKAEKVEEKIEEAGGFEEESQKEETPAEGEEDVKETETEEKKDEDVKIQEEVEDDEQKAKEEEEESAEQAAGFDTKPKLRRSFNLFKRRPQSMAAADRKMDEDSGDRGISRHDPVRHSYHAGDLPVPDPSNLREYLLVSTRVLWIVCSGVLLWAM